MNEIQQLVSRGRLAQAINKAFELTQGTEENSIAIALSARLKRLQKQENLGIISYSDANIERSKIVNAVLSLASELEENQNQPADIHDEPSGSGFVTPARKTGEKNVNPKFKDRKAKGFISYAHGVDRRLFREFKKGVEKYSTKVWDLFTDQDVPLGADWDDVLGKNINTCDFAILLLSQEFFNSPFIREKEFERFLERAETEDFLFFSVLLTDCDFRQWEGIRKMQMFVPYGQDYGLAKHYRDQQISFDQLTEFDRDGELIYNRYLNTFFRNFVEKANEALGV